MVFADHTYLLFKNLKNLLDLNISIYRVLLQIAKQPIRTGCKQKPFELTILLALTKCKTKLTLMGSALCL